MFVKRKARNPMGMLFPLLRKTRPRRDAVSGETEKNQTPYPPPWLNEHKDFNKPKKYPIEIDHKDGNSSNAAPWNLRWLTKLSHIEWTKMQQFPFRRKQKKGAPTRITGNKFSWEL